MVKLPSIFSSGMVIGKDAKLWGFATPHERVVATFMDETYETVADESGRFDLCISAREFGGPYMLNVGGVTIHDVYVGKVWLCGGSSNMDESASRAELLHDEKILENPQIRVFHAEKGFSFSAPAKDLAGKWHSATGWFLEHIPLMPYHFAKTLLEKDPDIPVGLICIPLGGTKIESWLPEEAVQNYPDHFAEFKNIQQPDLLKKTRDESDRRVKAWQNSLAMKDKGISERWFAPEYDDTMWETRMLLDSAKLPRHGSVWLRKKIVLPEMCGSVTLRFGRVENSVTVYINGKVAINVPYLFPPCACVLPEGLLKEGENTIAIRIVGDSHNPKIIPGKEYALVYPSGRTDLDGRWKWRTGAVMPMCAPSVYFPSLPCGVYNFMLAPLLGLRIDGIIWNQGESNTARPYEYKAIFTELANHLHKHFGNAPLIYTQIANYIDPYSYNFIEGFGTPGEYWAVLREQQRRCADIPNTAMVVTIDCGEYNDLHPTNKKIVGKRFALHARRLAYGEDIITDGPTVTKAEYSAGRLTIYFKHAEGLWAKDGHPLLDVIDEEGSAHRLFAAIWDDALNVIVGDMNPTLVRFGWADCPLVPLYNAYCLPASPFEIEITHV
ncbi:MAG: sialate O-acetylesterase [Defluviitaleaceae bacterium]|nr:sialate O-acetylesterase [Defluviitaleaceae bacterium]